MRGPDSPHRRLKRKRVVKVMGIPDHAADEKWTGFFQGEMETENLLREHQDDQVVSLLREHQDDQVVEEEDFCEEQKEIGIATLTLISIKNSTPLSAGPVNSGLLVLTRPHVPSIESIITQCSQPFGKELTKSDVNETQSRLLINKADALNYIYPLLGEDTADSMKKGVQVKVFNEYGKVYKMLLKSWCGNNKSNVLTTGWMAFVNDMGLKCEVDYVTLWAFHHRQTGGLCFLIAVRRMNGVEKRKDYCV